MNRTDGSLVRLSTIVPDASAIPDGDARLEDFARSIAPRLAYHIPDARAPARTLAALP
jgi:hypothetical protein